MLDLETFGTRPGSVIRSIAAVQFDLDGKVGENFYRNIARESCEAAGLTVDPKTEQWWAEQSSTAKKALLVNPQPLKLVAKEFCAWFRAHGDFAWGHGANFDLPLWEAAAYAVGEQTPWAYWNARDTRTVYALLNFDTRDLRRGGVYHNALDDAHYQVRCVAEAIRRGLKQPAAGVFE